MLKLFFIPGIDPVLKDRYFRACHVEALKEIESGNHFRYANFNSAEVNHLSQQPLDSESGRVTVG